MARGVIALLISTVPQVLCHVPGQHGQGGSHHHFMGPMIGHHHRLDPGVTGSNITEESNSSLPQPTNNHQFDRLGLRSESTILICVACSNVKSTSDCLDASEGHVVSHRLPVDASMVAITRYYVAPPVASGYYLQPFSRAPPIPTKQGKYDQGASEGETGSTALPIDPVSHPDDAFPHQSPFHPRHKEDKARSPFDPRFRVGSITP